MGVIKIRILTVNITLKMFNLTCFLIAIHGLLLCNLRENVNIYLQQISHYSAFDSYIQKNVIPDFKYYLL